MSCRGYARPLFGEVLLAFGRPHPAYALRYPDLRPPPAAHPDASTEAP